MILCFVGHGWSITDGVGYNPQSTTAEWDQHTDKPLPDLSALLVAFVAVALLSVSCFSFGLWLVSLVFREPLGPNN